MINEFTKEYGFLSNFYPSPITDGNVTFPTVEHYFQAAKTTNEDDYQAIVYSETPGDAKRAGRQVALRTDWENVKDGVMLEALRKKFEIPALRQKLLATNDEELVEGTRWHDNYWGNCTCIHCQNIEGQNKLGKMLMQIREEIKSSI